MLKCSSLRCEYRKNPIGIDVAKPRFSWKLESDQTGVMQVAYELSVGDVWSTGRVESDQSVHVTYDGAPLAPFTRYPFRVRVWDNHGEESAFAEGAFDTGLLSPENWSAEWITPGEDKEECPVLRREFQLVKPIRSARLYITALGLYEAELNGQRVGDAYLTPGYTSYNKHLLYQTYDVTDQLGEGNALAVTLSRGWCRGRMVWEGNYNVFKCQPGLLAQLRVEYEDGCVETIGTDTNWRFSYGPVQLSEIYDGETYDARRELEGVSMPGYDDSAWTAVKPLDYPKAHITAQEGEPVRICDTVKPVSIITTPKGETVIDFGQNMVGWASFTVNGKAGDRVVFTHAEVLDADGNFYTENMRSAKNRIEYVLRGGEPETYHPHFAFEGFRYIRIEEFPGEVTPACFTGLVIHTDMERTGNFSCSNEEVNQLFRNVIWGQIGNFVDVPTDCPQRDERLGWTGDAQVFVRAAALNFNVDSFFTKWLVDLACDQTMERGVPDVVPNIFDADTSSAWGDAAVICPWELYRAYGDRRILEQQYDSMTHWVEYIRAQGDNEFLWNTGHHYGDWLGLDNFDGSYDGRTAKDFIATAFFAHAASLVAKAARVLGNDADAEKYQQLHEDVKAAFRREFITPSGRLSEDTQTAHVLALWFDLSTDRARNAKRLAELVEENENKLTTGFVGTPYLCHVLAENGYPELAWSLLLQTEYPSWLYSVRKGATTIWEHWDGIKPDGSFWSRDMNSYNHYAYGSIADWMYSKAAGINYDEAAPGYRKIVFRPLPDDRLDNAGATVETMYGLVESSWVRNADGITFHVTVPANTTAEFIYPDGRTEQLGSGTYQFEA